MELRTVGEWQRAELRVAGRGLGGVARKEFFEAEDVDEVVEQIGVLDVVDIECQADRIGWPPGNAQAVNIGYVKPRGRVARFGGK